MKEPLYIKQKPLLNQNEKELFEKLKLAVGNDYLLVPQVHLEKLIAPRHGSFIGKIKYAVGHISRWSVDFALFDINTLEPMLAIELNGESHDVLKKKLQDEDVKRHFDEAGLPIIIFHNHQSLTVQELKTSIDLKLGKGNNHLPH